MRYGCCMSVNVLLHLQQLAAEVEDSFESVKLLECPDIGARVHAMEQRLTFQDTALQQRSRDISGVFLLASRMKARQEVAHEFVSIAEELHTQLNADLEMVSLLLMAQNGEVDNLDEECRKLKGETRDCKEREFEIWEELKQMGEPRMGVNDQCRALRLA